MKVERGNQTATMGFFSTLLVPKQARPPALSGVVGRACAERRGELSASEGERKPAHQAAPG